MGEDNMCTVDWIILILNTACLVGSIIGAFNALNSYKKCKQLTNFANLNIAIYECRLVLDNCHKLLKLCGKAAHNKRGTNPNIEITEYGCSIKNSFATIKEKLPSSSQKTVNKMLSASPNLNLDIEQYVSLLISGQTLIGSDDSEDNKTEITKTINNITEIEKTVDSILLHIKKEIENIQESEKKM